MLLLIVWLTSHLYTEEKSLLQLALEADQEINTKQYHVVIDGMPYTKVEAEGKFYYFRTLKKEKAIPIHLCERPDGFESERLVETSLKITKRKRLFFRGLVEGCTTRDPVFHHPTPNKRTWLELDPILGIELLGEPGDYVQKARMGVNIETLMKGGVNSRNPLELLNFSGEF
jgi:hypothetical protein